MPAKQLGTDHHIHIANAWKLEDKTHYTEGGSQAVGCQFHSLSIRVSAGERSTSSSNGQEQKAYHGMDMSDGF